MADLDIDPSTKLFRRMLRLPLFYALQPLHDSSINDANFNIAVQAYGESLDAIERFLAAYCSLIDAILSMKALPPYDPSFVAQLSGMAANQITDNIDNAKQEL